MSKKIDIERLRGLIDMWARAQTYNDQAFKEAQEKLVYATMFDYWSPLLDEIEQLRKKVAKLEKPAETNHEN